MNWRRAPRLPEARPLGATVLEASGVVVELGGREVVSGVDACVRSGELVALVGPNGAGKSTLLAALAGDRAPDAGWVRIHGEPVGSWTDVELAMRRAVLPQQSKVAFPFPVRDVVGMGRAPWSSTATRDEDRAAVAVAIRAAGIEHLLERSFGELSGGEQARVALARVLAQDTQVLLLDEPTAALDVAHQEHVLSAVRDRVDAGAAGVLVVHDLELAAAYADRVVLLAEGCVVADGPPPEVLTPELLSTVYGHPLEVLEHPRTASPVVLPVRAHSACPALTTTGLVDRRSTGPATAPQRTGEAAGLLVPPTRPAAAPAPEASVPDPRTEPNDAH